MKLTPQSKASFLKSFFGKIPSFSRKDNSSILWLNATQFFGVINDNIFKFVVAYLLIDSLGKEQASTILSATGAVYVIPFLLFSSSAGILADKFSKQKLLVLMKTAEIGIMILAIFAFGTKSTWLCLSLLFLLSTHSALFGPSKYGIIPELVPSNQVSKANGLITSFTYLAIIIGTFFASFLTEITNRHFPLIAGFCLAVAAAGFFCSLFVKPTPSQGSSKKMSVFFVREIYHTLVACRTQKHMLPAIFGSAFFLFIGAFTQLNIIPFAINALNLSEVSGGYLFLATSLGIALGALIAGKASRKQIELGISCLAGVGLSLFFFLLYSFSSCLPCVIAFLVFIGILGGIFIVPFDTFIQLHSADEKRGQTIAAANFLSFAGVLIASLCLYIFNEIFDLSAAASFAVVGIITILVTFLLTARLSDLALMYLSQKILQPLAKFHPPSTIEIQKASNPILFLENSSWLKALLLLGSIPNIHLLIPTSTPKRKHWFLGIFYSIHFIPDTQEASSLLSAAKAYQKAGAIPCILIKQSLSLEPQATKSKFLDIFKRSPDSLFQLNISKLPRSSWLTLQINKIR